MSAIGKRYARAAVLAAEERAGSDAVAALADGLSRFCATYEASPELRELLLNPALLSDRERMLDVVLGEAGSTDEVGALVRILSQKGRIELLNDVVAEVEAIADERAGRLRAFVSSATALTESQVARVAKALAAKLGKPVVVSQKVAPEFLGGMVCRVGDLTFDSSLRRQLAVLREQLEHRSI